MDDGRIVGREHKWFQDALMVTVAMLRRMGIDYNLEKTKAMVCTPGFIWRKGWETLYKRRATGEGATFWERKKTRVSCTECRAMVAASYLKTHMAQIHGLYVSQTRGVDKIGGGKTTYVV